MSIMSKQLVSLGLIVTCQKGYAVSTVYSQLFFISVRRSCQYIIGSNRSTKRGGGVGLYVSNQLDFKNRTELDKYLNDIIETKFIEIINKNGKNIIVEVVYRLPSGNFDSFKQVVNEILETVHRENKLRYLMGDFNIYLNQSLVIFLLNNYSHHPFSHLLLRQRELLITLPH